jgi:hypothetical protein
MSGLFHPGKNGWIRALERLIGLIAQLVRFTVQAAKAAML